MRYLTSEGVPASRESLCAVTNASNFFANHPSDHTRTYDTIKKKFKTHKKGTDAELRSSFVQTAQSSKGQEPDQFEER